MADIALSAAVRANLLSLQRTDQLISQTQVRLAPDYAVIALGITDDLLPYFLLRFFIMRAPVIHSEKVVIPENGMIETYVAFPWLTMYDRNITGCRPV